jgi:hypothetical protein
VSVEYSSGGRGNYNFCINITVEALRVNGKSLLLFYILTTKHRKRETFFLEHIICCLHKFPAVRGCGKTDFQEKLIVEVYTKEKKQKTKSFIRNAKEFFSAV